MSDTHFLYPASVIAGKARLSVDDIVLLRKHMFPVGLTCPDDALQLLALHRADVEKCSNWDTWFVESMADYIVRHVWPQHSLDSLNATWMMAMFAPDGVVETPAELEVVLHSMELAAFVPAKVSMLALDQMRIALETGTGAYAANRVAKRPGISRADIEYLYRILRGCLREGRLLLSGPEIAVIERIDALVRSQINHPAWDDMLRSISRRDAEGYVTPVPWLQIEDCLSRAA